MPSPKLHIESMTREEIDAGLNVVCGAPSHAVPGWALGAFEAKLVAALDSQTEQGGETVECHRCGCTIPVWAAVYSHDNIDGGRYRCGGTKLCEPEPDPQQQKQCGGSDPLQRIAEVANQNHGSEDELRQAVLDEIFDARFDAEIGFVPKAVYDFAWEKLHSVLHDRASVESLVDELLGVAADSEAEGLGEGADDDPRIEFWGKLAVRLSEALAGAMIAFDPDSDEEIDPVAWRALWNDHLLPVLKEARDAGIKVPPYFAATLPPESQEGSDG